MADTGKRVRVRLKNNKIGTIPEESIQEALNQGAELLDTAPPPAKVQTNIQTPQQPLVQEPGVARTSQPPLSLASPTNEPERQSFLSIVPPIYEGAKRMAKGAKDFTYSLWEEKDRPGALQDVISGVGAQGLLDIPAQAMRFFGQDPSRVKVPGVYYTDPSGEKQQATLQTIGQAPETPAGQLGSILGTGAQFLITRRAVGGAKLDALAKQNAPKIISTVASRMPQSLSQSPFMSKFLIPLVTKSTEKTLPLPLDWLLSAAQSFSKSGDPDRSIEDANMSSIIDFGLGMTSSAVGKAARFGKDYFAKKALPFIENVNASTKKMIDYGQELANRMIETKSVFSRTGADAIDNRFNQTVGALKSASDEADALMQELNNMKLVSNDALRLVDYGSEVRKAVDGLDGLKREQVSQSQINRIEAAKEDVERVLPKELKLDAKGNPIPVPAKDPFGNKIPVLAKDASGKEIPTGQYRPVYKVDSEGNPVFKKARDAHGNLIVAATAPDGSPIFQIEYDPKTGRKLYEQDIDANGKPKFEPVYKQEVDASGNPVFEQAKNAFGEDVFETTGKTRSLTFKEAEEWKEKFNKVLKQWYENKLLDPEKSIDKQIKMTFADAIRTAQQKAFDRAKDIKDVISRAGKIPSGSVVEGMNPWDVRVPGVSRPMSYSDAAHVARMDADLSQAAWAAQKKSTTQAAAGAYNPMAVAIAAAQAVHGSIFSPSQMASGWRALTFPVGASRTSKFLGGIATPTPFKTAIPKRASKGYLAYQTSQPPTITPIAQSLLEEQEVKPLPTADPAYFRNRQMQ